VRTRVNYLAYILQRFFKNTVQNRIGDLANGLRIRYESQYNSKIHQEIKSSAGRAACSIKLMRKFVEAVFIVFMSGTGLQLDAHTTVNRNTPLLTTNKDPKTEILEYSSNNRVHDPATVL
jgi:hypothetical protein